MASLYPPNAKILQANYSIVAVSKLILLIYLNCYNSFNKNNSAFKTEDQASIVSFEKNSISSSN